MLVEGVDKVRKKREEIAKKGESKAVMEGFFLGVFW
jgi:hypothetical protein